MAMYDGLVTCEHGGNTIPQKYKTFFTDQDLLLAGHRELDIGALELATLLSRRLQLPLYANTISRLLVDCNRRPTHRSLFSFVTRTLPALQKSDILNTYHRPHWSAIEAAVAKRILAKRTVVHLGVHSFTPILKGNVRRCDIGLLYDPSRRKEKSFCRAWQKSLKQTLPGCTIRRNYPYRGNADGLTTWLRSRHGQGYLGIELEVNQKYLQPDNDSRSLIEEALVHTLRPLLDHEAGD